MCRAAIEAATVCSWEKLAVEDFEAVYLRWCIWIGWWKAVDEATMAENCVPDLSMKVIPGRTTYWRGMDTFVRIGELKDGFLRNPC